MVSEFTGQVTLDKSLNLIELSSFLAVGWQLGFNCSVFKYGISISLIMNTGAMCRLNKYANKNDAYLTCVPFQWDSVS
jgi:hypothetical protein